MEFKDYYKTLGVPKSASEKDIKQAYRKLARKHHPDVNPNNKESEKTFREINEANAVLSDPEKRKTYDTLGPDWQKRFRQGAGPGAAHTRTYTASDLGEFSDFFESIFGGQRTGGAGQRGGAFEFDLGSLFSRGRGGRQGASSQPAAGQIRGGDLEQKIDITLREAFNGTNRTFTLSQPDGGSENIQVRIPAGVHEGSRVRVRGKGHPGGGSPGDLYLVVHVLPDPLFKLDGSNLSTEVNVPLTRLVLGGESDVPTLNGSVSMKIPAGTQNGRVFKLTGQGMPHIRGDGHGDLFARVTASLPTDLDDQQRSLFQQLAATGA